MQLRIPDSAHHNLVTATLYSPESQLHSSMVNAATQLPSHITAAYDKEVSELEDAILAKMQHHKGPFPGKTNLWKIFFMEWTDINGKYGFDQTEKGYLRGVMRAYSFMLDVLNQRLDANLYRALHDLCVNEVFDKDGVPFPLGFRQREDGAEAFHLLQGETYSDQGLVELRARFKDTRYSYHISKNNDDNPDPDLYHVFKRYVHLDQSEQDTLIKLPPIHPADCHAKVQRCIDLYYASPRTNESEKLRAIVRLCQDLDQIHVFVDGNIRTTGILTLNFLLLQEGLCPAVLADVNILDGLSENELIKAVLKGQMAFLDIAAGKDAIALSKQ